ncbi:CHAT domain-containing tetratricopeptide repeat protein [Nonomuraea insulae]|uniref:CHAT domain-containing protein n=1 Tax=Nonomuraea insulae TaxID=1616787 RepID=A0ABW1CG67_9ACTN
MGQGEQDPLEAVRARLHRHAADDAEAILEPGALKDAGRLLLHVAEQQEDLRALRVAGLLFWHRAQLSDQDDELIPALALLAPVWEHDPRLVPAALDEFFRDQGTEVVRRTDRWHGPAVALSASVERTGDAGSAAIVVGLFRQVLAALPAEDPELAKVMSNLASALQARYEHGGGLDDLDEAIETGRRAFGLFPEGGADRLVPLTALAVALRRRSGLTGRLEELEEAVSLARQAAGATPPGSPAFAERHVNLAVALVFRFEWRAEEADLTEAVALHRLVLADGGAGNPKRATHLCNLATALYTRFDAGGGTADLTAAIEATREAMAVQGLPVPVRAAGELNLCNYLRARFHYSNASEDLDAAVRAGQAAADLLTEHSPTRPAALANLGMALHVRFGRKRAETDLERAIEVLRESATLTPAGHPDLPGRLSSLCNALITSAEHAAGAGNARHGHDIDAAVETGRQAVDAATGHPRRAMYLSNLSNALLSRYELTQDDADLGEAVAVGDRAVAASPPGSPWLAVCLANLAVALRTRFERQGDAGDHDRSVATAERASGMPAGYVAVRIRSAARQGHWAAQAGDWQAGLAGLARAVGLLSGVAPRDLPHDDQEFELARLGGLGSDAAACALNAGDTVAAVRLLERGRGIVLAHAMSDAGSLLDEESWPLDESSIKALAGHGPVALLNVSRFRSDALLLTPEGVLVEPLPTLSPAVVREKVADFLVALETRRLPDATGREREEAELALSGTLAWLWEAVAGPVLERLGITGPVAHERLWWCPSGLLSLLPLHAAGHHDRPGEALSVLDRVISSVTPTLAALAHARRPASGDRTGDLLMVAMPETQGQSALPAVTAEHELLASLFGEAFTALVGPRATAPAVLAAMRGHRRVHIACHAAVDLDNSSRSGLLLGPGGQVTAADLARLRAPGAELAFLAACETARTGPALADEAIHLASALQAAGYRHVVAALWPVIDRPAWYMTRQVYGDLAAHDDLSRLPGTIHAATRRLRDRYRGNPFAWAVYVHMGA